MHLSADAVAQLGQPPHRYPQVSKTIFFKKLGVAAAAGDAWLWTPSHAAFEQIQHNRCVLSLLHITAAPVPLQSVRLHRWAAACKTRSNSADQACRQRRSSGAIDCRLCLMGSATILPARRRATVLVSTVGMQPLPRACRPNPVAARKSCVKGCRTVCEALRVCDGASIQVAAVIFEPSCVAARASKQLNLRRAGPHPDAPGRGLSSHSTRLPATAACDDLIAPPQSLHCALH